jgi:putative exporter of polyketide antibiotics
MQRKQFKPIVFAAIVTWYQELTAVLYNAGIAIAIFTILLFISNYRTKEVSHGKINYVDSKN